MINVATILGSESGSFHLPIKEFKGTKRYQGQRPAIGEISSMTEESAAEEGFHEGRRNTLNKAHLEEGRQRPSAKQRRVSGD